MNKDQGKTSIVIVAGNILETAQKLMEDENRRSKGFGRRTLPLQNARHMKLTFFSLDLVGATKKISRYACLFLMWFAYAAIAAAQVPGTPTNLYPADGSQVATTNGVTLSWDAVAGATSYSVRANDNSNPGIRDPRNTCPGSPHYLCIDGVTGSSLSLPVNAGDSYTWWVHACNQYGCSSASIANFSIGVAASPPNPPEGIAPPNGSVLAATSGTTLSWQGVAGATSYSVRANNNSNPGIRDPRNTCPGSPHYLCIDGVTGSSLSLPVNAGDSYTWWVHACNTSGCGGVAAANFSVGSLPAYSGYSDVLNQFGDGFLRGWACKNATPNLPLPLLIYRDGRYVGRTSSGQDYRPDVNQAGYCSGNQYTGWRFSVPDEEYDERPGNWQARVDDGAETPISGGNVQSATLPTKSFISYMQQPCYTTADVASHFSERPGKVLDQPALGWGFTVSVNGSIPLSPVTTWNGGVHTGTNVPQSDWYAMQRGDARTSGSEQADILTGRSMLQLNCNSAGIMLNNFWLDPVANEATAGGPQAAYSTVFRFNDDRPKLNISSGLLNTLQTYQPGRFSTGAAVHRPFATLGTSFVMDAYVVAPAFYISAANASYMPGGQMSYFVYFWDTKSGNSFAVLFALWATKDVAGTAGVGHDGNTFFVGQRVGGSAPFGMWLAGSAADWTPSVTFSTDRHFSIKITRDHLVTAIAAINATPGSGTPLSTDPADYVLTDVGYQAEIAFPNMSMGASVRNFSAYLTRY